MNTLLYFLIVIGLIEVGGSLAYLIVGKWPERTRGSVVANCVSWAAMAGWAATLLWSAS